MCGHKWSGMKIDVLMWLLTLGEQGEQQDSSLSKWFR